MVVTSVSVDEAVEVIDCCEVVDELGLVVEREPDCVLVPDCEVDDVSDGEVIGGVATLPAVLPDGVPLLVSGEIDVELEDALVELSSEDAPDEEPLSVPELLVAPVRDDVSVSDADGWVDDDELDDGDGNVTVADEPLPDVSPEVELLLMLEPELDEEELGVEEDCVWLVPDCACSPSVAANSAIVLVPTNFRAIFIVTRSRFDAGPPARFALYPRPA